MNTHLNMGNLRSKLAMGFLFSLVLSCGKEEKFPVADVDLNRPGVQNGDTSVVKFPPDPVTGMNSEMSPFSKGNARLSEDTLIARLSEARSNIGSAYYRGKLFYAGGAGSDYSKALDIHDLENNRTIRMDLSAARMDIVAVPCGDLVLFAGGIGHKGASGQPEPKDLVDIYDVSTGIVSLGHLSIARTSPSGTASDSIAYFAGGDDGYGTRSFFSRVDLYHTKSRTWTTAELSAGRICIGAATANGKAIFAGGYNGTGELSDLVDIYDESTGAWTVSRMPFKKAFGKTFRYRNRILFLDRYGGQAALLDPVSMEWSLMDIRNAEPYVAGQSLLQEQLFEIGVYKAVPSRYALLTSLPQGKSDTVLLHYDLNYASVETDGKYLYIAGGQSEYRTKLPHNRGIYRLTLK